ncbi:unnamed protein product [Didymodactylos carnosus]|uniref:DDE Tnp4 domain-containing protein n=1 Tax=Didymodactylos carnosus TaxID=1234261 RepID=A0A815BSJ2_9BILA|nr:unnamed protein product [Didymodactylos carnosus]CAF1274321.1 unnamed protein product [Didymodactylos carnosus]CAF3734444.1 unnamed protein product [Didymodactylos carnosus]CAF4064677.1 unnamed protein product [Didymodactylos carnosus]
MLATAGVRNIPPHTRLLADKSFVNGDLLLTPVRRNELRHFPAVYKDIFNYYLLSKRFFVEHLTKEMKIFEAVHGVYRHEKMLWYGVSLCATYLANVRADMFLST